MQTLPNVFAIASNKISQFHKLLIVKSLISDRRYKIKNSHLVITDETMNKYIILRIWYYFIYQYYITLQSYNNIDISLYLSQ